MSLRACIRRALTALILLAGLAVPTAGARAEVWIVASLDNFPPYNFTLKGKRTGLDTEIVDSALKRMGVLPVHQSLSWQEVLTSLEKDRLDLAYQFVATPERFQKYHMIGPVRTGETVFMVRRDSDIAFTSLEDLAGLQIGYVQGFRYTREFDEATHVIKVPASSDLSNIRRLLMGRIDMVIGDRHTLTFFADQEAKLGKVKFLSKPLGHVDRYFAMPKSRTGKAERFKAMLEEMRRDGALEQIILSWRDRQR